MTNRTLLKFLALVFGIGWLCQMLAIANGIASGGRVWLMAAMWAPLVAGLLAGADARRMIWAGLKRGGFKYWPMALIVGWSGCILQQLLLCATHHGHWNAEVFHLSPDGHRIESVDRLAMVLGVGSQSIGLFALNLVLSVTLGSLVSMLMGGIGEEAGWRGFLQPVLANRFGLVKGTFAVGLIWGYWHLPANLAGYNDSVHPWVQAVFIFQIFTVTFSVALAFLVRWTHSIWPAALAHSANNTLQSGVLVIPDNWPSDQITASLASIAVGVVAAVFLMRQQARKAAPTASG